MLDCICERCGRFDFESLWSCRCANLLLEKKGSMIGIGSWRSASSEIRRSNRREEGGESSGDYKEMHDENKERGRWVKFGQ